MSILNAGIFLFDLYLSICHFVIMTKRTVRVSGGDKCFRVVIPRKIIEELNWDGVTHVVVEKFEPHGLKIRRVFDGSKEERQDT